VAEKSKDSQFSSAESIALAELVAYIEELRLVSDDKDVPVFRLADLVAVYTERMQDLISEPVGKVNSTRLKERLLQQCMFLKAVRHGRNVLLTYDSAVGDAIVKACSDEDEEAMELANAAKIVRKHILNCGHSFNGSLCEPDNVPS